jgi:hypothetical protein
MKFVLSSHIPAFFRRKSILKFNVKIENKNKDVKYLGRFEENKPELQKFEKGRSVNWSIGEFPS